MTYRKFLYAAAFGCLLGLVAPMEPVMQKSPLSLSLSVKAAKADSWGQNRRVARRTARRTSRRSAARLNALPRNCPRSGPYFYCGGVYYQPITEGSSTVYVVVTP
ncbi:MAG: hypothetical protein Kilf2KO_12890 [Rhodospirillales bacterium]